MLVSYAEGRVRLRFKELQNSATAKAVEQYINAIEGIENVEVKSLTGSILIQYNHALLPTQMLLQKGLSALNHHGIEFNLPAEVLAFVR